MDFLEIFQSSQLIHFTDESKNKGYFYQILQKKAKKKSRIWAVAPYHSISVAVNKKKNTAEILSRIAPAPVTTER